MTDPHPTSVPPANVTDVLLSQAGFLRALTRELVRDPQAGDDLAQATWLAALERSPGALENPRAWLARVARRLAGRRARTEARRTDREALAARPEALPSAGETVARESVLRSVTEAVLALDEPLRSLVLARYFEGLELREIAERDGVPLPTLKSRLARGHELLRARLDREHGERRTWCVALVALLGRRGGLVGAGTGTTTGALVVSMKLKLTVVTLLILAGLLALRGRPERVPQDAAVPFGNELVAVDAGSGEPAPPEAASSARAQVPGIDPRTDLAARPGTGSVLLRARWSDGSPAAGLAVQVHAYGTPDEVPDPHVVTDASGEARCADLLPGLVAFLALNGGTTSATVTAGEEAPAALEVPLGVTVRGRVIDLEGRPAPGAEVWLSDPGGSPCGAVVTACDGRGGFELRDVSSGVLSAHRPGSAPSPGWRISGAPGGVRQVELVLQGPGAALALRVLDGEGAPVVGAPVTVFAQEHSRRGYPEGTPLERSIAPTLVTGADGRCRSTALLAGPVDLVVQAGGLAPLQRTVELEAGRERSLELVLAAGWSLSGLVLAPDGTPAARVPIRVGAPGDRTARFTATGPDGRYALRGLPAGERELVAGRADTGHVAATVSGADGESRTLDLRLDEGRIWRGRLVDERGAPLGGWTVAAGAGGHGPDGPASFQSRLSTDDQGRFVVRGAPAAPLWLEVRADPQGPFPEGAWDALDPAPGEHTLVVLDAWRASAFLEGRVRDRAGAPAEAWLALHAPGGRAPLVAWSTAGGAFRLGPLAPGSYTLELSDVGGTAFGRRTDLELAPDETRDLGELWLGGPGTLALALRAGPGVDLERVWLAVLTPAQRQVLSLAASEAQDGIELAPGSYRLIVLGAEPHDTAFEVDAGGTTRLALDLVVGVRRTVRLVLPRGTVLPIEGEALLRGADGTPAGRSSIWCDPDEAAEVATLVSLRLPAAQDCELEVRAGGLTGRAFLEAAGWTPATEPEPRPPLPVELRP